jgi:hypothetical protein
MTYITTIANHHLQTRAKIFWISFAMLVALASTYGFLLNATIADVVFVEENKGALSASRSSIASLEEQYLMAMNTVTLDSAHSIGLIDDANPSYVKVSALHTELTLERAQ